MRGGVDGGTAQAGRNTFFKTPAVRNAAAGAGYLNTRFSLLSETQLNTAKAHKRRSHVGKRQQKNKTKIKTRTHKQSARFTQSEVEIQTIHTKREF